jgi:A/G-specific adenine glycosylase
MIEINPSEKQKKTFANKIIDWYLSNKRDLPWRETQNPYYILLSEIILQQTRVSQGLPYYETFVKKFPRVEDLANAKQEEVLRVWQGLGYYSRGRNLHYTAQEIVQKHGGKVPNTYEELLQLKGIGTYTASAIASFAYGIPKAVLDGNVFRVLARYWGIEDDIANAKSKNKFLDLANLLLPNTNSNTYNQGIMEFGAIQCTPQNPNCEQCVLKVHCYAYLHQLQNSLPYKSKKISKKRRRLNYFVFLYKNQIAMQIRSSKDIWKGLYEFYLFSEHENIVKEKDSLPALEELGILSPVQQFFPLQKHILTHLTLDVRFVVISITEPESKKMITKEGLKFYTLEEIENLPKPILFTKFLENNKFS